MLRYCEEWRDSGIRLAGSQFQIVILGVPTAKSRVILCYGFQRLSTRCPRRIRIQVVLEDLLFNCL
jgi:hypothetical protein